MAEESAPLIAPRDNAPIGGDDGAAAQALPDVDIRVGPLYLGAMVTLAGAIYGFVGAAWLVAPVYLAPDLQVSSRLLSRRLISRRRRRAKPDEKRQNSPDDENHSAHRSEEPARTSAPPPPSRDGADVVRRRPDRDGFRVVAHLCCVGDDGAALGRHVGLARAPADAPHGLARRRGRRARGCCGAVVRGLQPFAASPTLDRRLE